MRPTLMAIIFSLTLLLPTTLARPRDVHACDALAHVGLALSTFGIGNVILELTGACQAFGEAPTSGCLIGDVGATAKIDANGLSHGYNYRLANECGDIRVQAGYAFKGGEAAERLEGGGRTVRASWYCSDDPWIYPSGQPPSCSRIAISVTGPNADAYADEVLTATFPLSAGVLAPISRQALTGQVGNAEKQARADASKAASQPVPESKVVVPPQVSPYVVLSRNSNDSPYDEALQYLLRHHGEEVEVDGNFGEQTEGAVRRFQNRKGIPESGRVDLRTWEALWVTVGIGANGDAVSAVQTLLNVHGFVAEVDGDFGEQTRAAVRAFQTNRGLIVGGVVDEKIWRALISPSKRT